MSSQFFPYAKQLFATQQLSWLAGTVRAVLLPEGVSFDFTERFLEDIPVGSRIATSVAVANRTAVNGILNAAPVEFETVLDSRLIHRVVFYRDTGDEATSPLIFLIDEDGIIGEPFAPQGVNYYLYPDAAFGGFCQL
jgi:hypothetical protein